MNMIDQTSNAVPRYDDNVPGPWYVNEECIFCDQCFGTAPDHFRPSDDFDHAIVYKQPETEEEIETATEAMEGCPTEAIVCATQVAKP